MQKAIKLSDTHYIVVDDSEIKDGEKDFYILANDRDKTLINCIEKVIECKIDPNVGKVLVLSYGYLYVNEGKKITHSTEPLEPSLRSDDNTLKDFVFIKPLSLSEIEEAINGYSAEKLVTVKYGTNPYNTEGKEGYKEGFKAAMELVKDKLFTIEDMDQAYINGINDSSSIGNKKKMREEYLQSLLPKTEWNIEFDEQGKIKLI